MREKEKPCVECGLMMVRTHPKFGRPTKKHPKGQIQGYRRWSCSCGYYESANYHIAFGDLTLVEIDEKLNLKADRYYPKRKYLLKY